MSAPAVSDKDMEDFFATTAMAAATARPEMLFESNFFDNSSYGFEWSSPFGPVATSTNNNDAITSGDAVLFDAFGQPSQLALDLSPSSFDLVLRPAGPAYSSASARSDAPRSRKLVHQLRPDGQGISSTELLSLEGQEPLGLIVPPSYRQNGYVDALPPTYGSSNSNMLPSTPPITPNPARIRPRTSTSPIRKHRTAISVPVVATAPSAPAFPHGPPAAKRSKSYSTLKAKPTLADRRSPKHQRSYHQLSMLQTSTSPVPNLPLSPPASSRFPPESASLSARSSGSGLRDFVQHNSVAHDNNRYALGEFSASSPPLWSESGATFEQPFSSSPWDMGPTPVFDTHQLHQHQHTSADPLSAASGSSLESQPSFAHWDAALAHAGLMITTDGYPWDLAHSAGSATPSISPHAAPLSSSTHVEERLQSQQQCQQQQQQQQQRQRQQRQYSISASSHPSHASPYDNGTVKRPSGARSKRSGAASQGGALSSVASEPRLSSPATTNTSAGASSAAAPATKAKSKKSYGSLRGAASSPRKVKSTTAMHSAASSGSAASGTTSSGSVGEVGFVNFTPSDSRRILTGVAPSGSSKTKARREREAIERRRRLSEAATKAVREAGGDLDELKRHGVLDEASR